MNINEMNNKNEHFTLNKDIWMFGGSTTWGTGSDDKNTIPPTIIAIPTIITNIIFLFIINFLAPVLLLLFLNILYLINYLL